MDERDHLFANPTFLIKCVSTAFQNLKPSVQYRRPIFFMIYVCAIWMTCIVFQEVCSGSFSWLNFEIGLWFWVTIFSANFAEAIAENQGKEQLKNLHHAKVEVITKGFRGGKEIEIPASQLQKDDVIFCTASETIPIDGDVIKGVATVDESAITGESAPVLRESGGDRSAVTAGTRILTGSISVRVSSELGKTFLDRIISLVEGPKQQKSPNEILLNVFLSALCLIFLFVVLSLKFFILYTSRSGEHVQDFISFPLLMAFFVSLLPTAISGLQATISRSSIERLIQYNVVAKSERAIEAAGDIDMLILDKTGTITVGDRMATAFYPAEGVDDKEFAKTAQLASLSDETPEGRSIVVFAKTNYSLRAETLETAKSRFIPFSPKTRISGIDLLDNQENLISSIRKGALNAIRKHVELLGGNYSDQFDPIVSNICNQGGTPLFVSLDKQIVGIIHLKDVIKKGIKERFLEMRRMGIQTLMVTGDSALTAAAIAAEVGVDDYIAEATPEIKLARIKQEQQKGRSIAMTGDGTSDAPALAQANVGVSMNTGTQTSREAGNMIDLDSNPTKLINIVEIGKQLLMTRGVLTTFSISNNVAKYFVVIPTFLSYAYFMNEKGDEPLSVLSMIQLNSPQSAILSTLAFNALVILALIPLALRGVKYQALPADKILKRNVLIYGTGGFFTSLVSIKLIDALMTFLR